MLTHQHYSTLFGISVHTLVIALPTLPHFHCPFSPVSARYLRHPLSPFFCNFLFCFFFPARRVHKTVSEH